MSSLEYLLEGIDIIERESKSPGFTVRELNAIRRKMHGMNIVDIYTDNRDLEYDFIPERHFQFNLREWKLQFEKYFFSHENDRERFCNHCSNRLRRVLQEIELKEQSTWDDSFQKVVKLLIGYIDKFLGYKTKKSKRISKEDFQFIEILSDKGRAVIESILKDYYGKKLNPSEYSNLIFSMIEEDLFTSDYKSILLSSPYSTNFHKEFCKVFSVDLDRTSMSKAIKVLREHKKTNNTIYSERTDPYRESIRFFLS